MASHYPLSCPTQDLSLDPALTGPESSYLSNGVGVFPLVKYLHGSELDRKDGSPVPGIRQLSDFSQN